ncbi:MAG: DUF5606 domain-containing protein [Muribaculaceae bacterium]|nr:DUF5606 domain-containing protein [Muribaculaceae bacterium]
MTDRILSITGKPGLYRLINQGKNMLIVENVATGKRNPVYARDKVISLADVAIYTTGEDMPLYDVFDKISAKNNGEVVDMGSLKDDAKMRSYFTEILPEFDNERVHNGDIRKVFQWYNTLVSNGIKDFKDEEIAEDQAAEAAEDADEAQAKE